MSKAFSDHAYEKLVDLYNNHSHEVGSELKRVNPTKYKDYESTDCITYALNVISYAFEKSGKRTVAKHVWTIGGRGTELARYLVNNHSWKGIYINPDAKHPLDADSEHPYTSHVAQQSCKYYQIPLQYRVENYRVTPKTHSAFQKVSKHAGVTSLNKVAISSLESVKFGFGVSRGGRHTWLFSKGKVYEVHWDQIGDSLYEASSLRRFPWLSGAIVVPLNQASVLEASAKLNCGG